MIALLDYDSGNIRSVEKALRRAGAEVVRARTPEAIAGARGIVLPGVGAFDDCVHAMERQGLLEAIRGWIASDRPFLGICVGYQALFERSEEFNSHARGLGVFGGPVVRFQPTAEMPRLKIPQIGWNQLDDVRDPLLRAAALNVAYYANSYVGRPTADGEAFVTAWSKHEGDRFPAAVRRANVMGTQFHPEKSSARGVAFVRAFLDFASSVRETMERTA